MNDDGLRTGTLLFEGRDDLESALSPDGRVRIEVHRVEDERTGVWITIQLIDVQDGEVLLSESNYRDASGFRFPRPGIVTVVMTDRTGEHREFEVDAAGRSFRMYRSEVFEPLARLPARLGGVDARAAIADPVVRPFFAGLVDALCAFASLVFVAGGAWMVFAAETVKDRWAGAAGVVFFGLCFWSFWSDWRQRAK